MNKVVLVGRLTKDCEIKITTNEKAVARFTLAVDRSYKKENGERDADFLQCVAWGKMAELINNHTTKGDRIGIVGQLQSRSWDGEDGKKHYATEVRINELEFLQPKKNNGQTVEAVESFTEVEVNDDNIPF